jgi:hypothetical protein
MSEFLTPPVQNRGGDTGLSVQHVDFCDRPFALAR